jgi:hypothetical protein
VEARHADDLGVPHALWRDGALFGATPEQAFYVKCDAETNPPEVIDAGQLVCEIGMCPVKPAEFVIFRIGQMAAGGGVEELPRALRRRSESSRQPPWGGAPSPVTGGLRWLSLRVLLVQISTR